MGLGDARIVDRAGRQAPDLCSFAPVVGTQVVDLRS